MQKITPHLWFDKEAKEAAEFYTSFLPDSKVTNITTLHDTPSGDCDVVSFELAGQPFMAISAGPIFKFNPSVSFHVKLKTEEAVTFYTSVFPHAQTVFLTRYGKGEEPDKAGTVKYAAFTLDGIEFGA